MSNPVVTTPQQAQLNLLLANQRPRVYQSPNIQPNVIDQGLIDQGLGSPQVVAGDPLANTMNQPGFNWNNFAAYGMQGLNVAGGLYSAYQAGEANKIARAGLRENRRQFDMNWDAQANLTNAELEQRRLAQISAQGIQSGNGMSAEEHVAKYGVKRQ